MYEALLKATPEYQKVAASFGSAGPAALFGLPPAGRALLYAALQKDLSRVLCIVTPGEAEAMVRGDKLSSGMIPKLSSCVRALDSGVSAAHIINGTVPHALLLELLTDSGMGTMVGGLASAQFLNVSPVSKFAAKLIENR